MSLIYQHRTILPNYKKTETFIQTQKKDSLVILPVLQKSSLQPDTTFRYLDISNALQTEVSSPIPDHIYSIFSENNQPYQLRSSVNDSIVNSPKRLPDVPSRKLLKQLKRPHKRRIVSQLDFNSYLTQLNSQTQNNQERTNNMKRLISQLDKMEKQLQTDYKKQQNPVKKFNKKYHSVIGLEKNSSKMTIESGLHSQQRSEKSKQERHDSIFLNQQMDVVKFVKIDRASSDRKLSQYQSKFENENKEDIMRLLQVLSALQQNLQKLKEHLNNERKFFLVVRRLIGIRKILYKIIFQEEIESVIVPLTETNLFKRVTYKDIVYDNGEVIYVDKYNFAVTQDLQDLSDKCEELLLEIKLNSIRRLEDNIVSESEGILKLEKIQLDKEKALQYLPITLNNLRFSSNAMRMKDMSEQIQKVVSKFGELPQITMESKMISSCVSGIIDRMNKRDI